MAIVAGLFDSDANATQAMDKLLTQHLKDLDTRVIEPGRNTNLEGADALPIIPNTSGGYASGGSAPMPMGGGGVSRVDWLEKLDQMESTFYYEGLKEGATLVLAKVDDDDAARARQVMRDAGARTYEKK